MKTIRLSGREIGKGKPCFIIAEAGVNHNGKLETAHQLVDAAAKSRADAVKFQTFKADRIATLHAPKADYQKLATSSDESQFDMLRRLELSEAAHVELIHHCAEQGIIFLSSPFDESSADFLDLIGVLAFKTPSGEITNLSYLRHVAAKRKPMIVSTGMADMAEVQDAVKVILSSGNNDLILLHCVSASPADPRDVNLNAMRTMEKECRVPVGFSDHTLGIEIPFAAAALGACVIEKHFTLDRSMSGPDHSASIEPAELAAMVSGVRKIELALGSGEKKPALSEFDTAHATRKSLVAGIAIPAGVVLKTEMVVMRRPGTGLPPGALESLLGMKSRVPISAGTLLSLEMFEG